MAFDNSYTAVTGATYQASDYNTSTKGNFTAIWVGTTAGDMDYYTSATAKSRLALVTGGLLYGGATAPVWLGKGTTRQLLRAGTTYPEYGALVYRRQGGDASSWQTTGTTTYTPTTGDMQMGSASVASGSSTAITYPVAFSQRPLIFLSWNTSTGWYEAHWSDDSVSGFTIRLVKLDGGSGTIPVNWFAIGQI